ncbi:LysR family transcriptional regulator [Leucobacter sp. wl10]|nr:LysR family transcriptional regulator [Leucobacter sp. wl10]RGE23349.1 LysR family transcriptional regulator [Leucobacter sp. wl10]
MLDMKRLRLLWELSARGTVAAVAEALNYSPSAVSQQLAQLEREAGVPLLRKVGRTLEFTAAAKALVEEVGELLSGLERAEAALHREHDQVVGTVRIAIFQTVAHALMPQVMRDLRVKHPGLRIEMTEYEPEMALRETWTRGFDLVVAEQYPGYAPRHFEGLRSERLTGDPIRLALPADPWNWARNSEAVPPRFAVDDVIATRFAEAKTLVDVAGLPWVMEPKGAASRHFAEQACRQAGFEPDMRFETPDLLSHARLVESGNAVALLPGLLHAGEEHRLRFIELEGAPRRTVLLAGRASNEARPALMAVREALKRAADELPFE